MAWYYNNEGLAEGPLTEETMISLFIEGKISERSLIFNSEDQAWKSVEALSPHWLGLAQNRIAEKTLMSAKPEVIQVEPDAKPEGLLKKLLGYFGRK